MNLKNRTKEHATNFKNRFFNKIIPIFVNWKKYNKHFFLNRFN